MTDVQRLPVMTSEDKFLVERGALLSNSAYDIYSEARFNAYKAAQIILGATPNELQVEFSGGTSMAINEKAANKSKIKLNRVLYLEADVIAEQPEEIESPMTLSAAITRAVSFNPTVLGQKEAMAAAAKAASIAFSEYLPQLWASAGFGYRDDNYVNNSRDELKQDYFTSQINLKQKVFSLETIRSIKTAGKTRELANINSEKVQQELELSVTSAYLNFLKAQELLDVQKRIRELIERNIEVTGTRFLVENGSEYEHSRWRVERDKSIQAIIDATNNLKVARILLNTLLNFPVEREIAVPRDAFGERSVAITFERLSGYFNSADRIERIGNTFAAYASENNSDVRRQRQLLEIQESILSENKARFLPSLDLVASFHHADELNDTPPPFKEEKNSWTIGGLISLPLFLGGERFHEKNKLKAKYTQLEYERDDRILTTTAAVRSSLTDVVSSVDKLPVSARRVERTRFNLELAVNGYDAEMFDIQLMLDEIHQTDNSEIEAIANRYGIYESMAQLAFELGWTAYGSGSTFTQMIEDLVAQN
jgi:outer membrane protein TolC